MQEINDINELENYLNKTDKVILDFYSPTCGQCRRILRKLSAIDSKFNIVKVNAEEEGADNIIDKYSITSLPTLLLINKKSILGRFSTFNLEEIDGCLNE